MDILKKFGEPVLWFLTAVMMTWSWQLCGMAYLVCALIALSVAGVIVLSECRNLESRDLLFAALMMGVFPVLCAALGLGWALLIVAVYLGVIIFGCKETIALGTGVADFLFVMMLGAAAMMSHFSYWEDSGKYAEWAENFSKLKSVSPIKEKIQHNPLLFHDSNNVLVQDMTRMDSLSLEALKVSDKLVRQLRYVRTNDVNADLAQFDKKPEILIAKRIWLTSDVLPWTYSMWKSISYNMSFGGTYRSSGRGRWRSGGGQFQGSGTIRPNMLGSAEYIGNQEMSYINVIFSDNSYKRFSIKDNPEWLLVREGERVRVEYKVNYADGKDFSLEKMVDPYGSFSKTYVPLFK